MKLYVTVKKASRWFGALVILICIVAAAVIPAQAADSLKVKVAYFGCEAYDKAVFSATEVKSLGVISQTFTHIDSAQHAAYAQTEGVSLMRILNQAGVNTGRLRSCIFETQDGKGNGKEKYVSELFGNQRYAYPALAEYYGMPEDEYAYCITDMTAVQASAVPVTTVLAYRENYSRVDEFTAYDPSCYAMRSDTCWRLFYGQSYPAEDNASSTLYAIHTVIAYYLGSPTITAEESELTLSVDEDYTLKVNATAEDIVIAEAIQRALHFESSDSSVVSVDQNTGKLTVHKKGEVTITVTVNGYEKADTPPTASIKVTVNDNENLGDGGEGTGNGNGDGDGEGEGDGSGNANGTGDGEGNGGVNGNDDGSENGQPGSGNNQNSAQNNNNYSSGGGYYQEQATTSSSVTVSADDVENETSQNKAEDAEEMEDVTLSGHLLDGDGMSGGQSGGGGGSPIELVLQEDYMGPFMALAMLLLMAGGGAGMWVKYKKEI